MKKRKRVKISTKQEQKVLFFSKKENNTLPSIAKAVGIPLYHVHKIVNNQLNKK